MYRGWVHVCYLVPSIMSRSVLSCIIYYDICHQYILLHQHVLPVLLLPVFSNTFDPLFSQYDVRVLRLIEKTTEHIPPPMME